MGRNKRREIAAIDKNRPTAIKTHKGTNLDMVMMLLRIFEILTPAIFMMVSPPMSTAAMRFFMVSPAKNGKAAPSAVAKPTAIAAQAMMVTTSFSTPTS